MEDHHNVADLFHQVRTHGKWGCGNMLPIGTSMVPSEYLRCRWVLHGFGFNKFRLRWRSWWEVTGVLFCLTKAFWWGLLIIAEQMRRFHHHWYGDVYVLHVFCLRKAFRWDLLAIERTVRFRHRWYDDIWFSWWLHRDPSWNNGRIGVWTLCFWSEKERCFATSLCGSFTMKGCEVQGAWWCFCHKVEETDGYGDHVFVCMATETNF